MDYLNKYPLPLGLCAGIILFASVRHEVEAKPPASGDFLMCSPGEVLFSETFTPGTISERWGIRGYYKIDEGVLKRTGHQPQETARAFLKEAAFHNVILRFDFRFEGASELRLMTGGGGGYNAVTQISQSHFQVNTAKRNSEFAPSMQGECAFNFKEGKWYTMTVEFHGEEVVAHVGKEHFVVGRHPIINTERTYLAFQVSGGGAAFDNFFVWRSVKKDSWEKRRAGLGALEAARPPALKRDAREQYDLIMLNLKDRLSRHDTEYQELVARHGELQGGLKADYPGAFRTHKELSKSIASKRKEIKAREPRFREMESAVNKARRKEKEYIHSKHAELEDLPKHLYYAAFEKHRKLLRDDSELMALEKTTVTLEVDLRRAFPEAFEEVDVLIEKRKSYTASLKDDEGFQRRRKAIAQANDSIRNYLYDADPRLKELEAARMSIIQEKKK
ncbi:MAG: hypothetical protein CMP30_01350 [Roseibacillus sp.]|nr:hypothetical protein [Roseibacillus sp.]